MKTLFALALSCLLFSVCASQLTAQRPSLGSFLQEQIRKASEAAATLEPEKLEAEPEPGNRWVLILCGLPGDEEYSEKMVDAIKKLHAASTNCLDTEAERIRVLAGDQTMIESLAETTGPIEATTADTVANLVADLQPKIAPSDSLWVFIIGHADLQGRASRWNVADTDPDQKTFAKWFQGIQCRQKVFWMTTPLSGFFIRNLSAPGTVVISATQADLEISATEMPYALADILSGEEDVQAAGDRDEDGQTTLLDLYLAVCHEVADRYQVENLFRTENALIDDNGDRRGTELQQRYLPEELGGQPPTDRVRRQLTSLDGSRAAAILLPKLPVAKPKPDEEAEEADEDSEDQPEDSDSQPEDTDSQPEDSDSEAEDSVAEPEDANAESEDTIDDPEQD